jgi:ribosomal protein S18 acetylase RimI-like enzyme
MAVELRAHGPGRVLLGVDAANARARRRYRRTGF